MFEIVGACQIREPAFFGLTARNLWEALLSLEHVVLEPNFTELFSADFQGIPLLAGVDNTAHRLVRAMEPTRFQDMKHFGLSCSKSGWNCRFHPIHLYGLLRDYSRQEDLSLLLCCHGEEHPVTISREECGLCLELHHSCLDQEMIGSTEIFVDERFIIGNAGIHPKQEERSRFLH